MNRRDNGGAALVWAVCALLIMGLLTLALAAMAGDYHRRSLTDAAHRQAGLTARGAVDTLVTILECGLKAPAEPSYAALRAANPWLPEAGESAALNGSALTLPLPGTVAAIALKCREEDGTYRLTVTAIAVLDDATASRTARTALTFADGAPVWSFERYE